MGFLDKFSTGASAASSAVGALGGVSSLLFGASQQRKAARYQQKLQMELNEQQQRFARANALADYQRQRELTHDTALLEKQGRQAAGLSTAGDFGSGPATVNSTASPSAGSAPSLPDPNTSILAGISQLQSSANSFVQNRAAMANAEAQELQNDITKHALAEKIIGAKGDGLKAGLEAKKAGTLFSSEIQKGKDEASITANELWKSNNDAAYASVNAFNNASTMLSQMLQAKVLLDKAKLDKSLSAGELQLFEDTYKYSVESAKQNVVNLKKQGVVLDTQADANKASASASRANANLLNKKAVAQDIENAVNGNPKVKEAARTRLLNIARESGPQGWSEYAWSVFNDPHSTTGQKWKAVGALVLDRLEKMLGAASSAAGKAAGATAGQAAALNAIVRP